MHINFRLLPIVLTVFGYAQMSSLPNSHNPSSVLLIHIQQTPTDETHHRELNKQIHILVDEMNVWLELYKQQLSWWDQLKLWIYASWDHQFCFTRFDYHFGNASICVPSCIDRQMAIDQLEASIKYKQLPFILECDCDVQIARNPDIGLEGYALSLDVLERLKRGGNLTSNHLPASQNEIKEALFWHHYLPTIGLRVDSSDLPSYPFLPHYFSLWELAPSKGKGIKVAIIDTGVAAFGAKDNNSLKKNYDLEMKADFNQYTYNVVSQAGLDPIERCIQMVIPLLGKEANHAELEQRVPRWIKECLKQGKSPSLQKFIHQHGDVQQKDVASIEQFITENFNLLNLDHPYKTSVIEQFVPAAKINRKKTTFVAGHGSHAFGTIAGALTDHAAITPDNDIGICGLSPAADVIMIKAFKDDGMSNKSSLINALKRAIAYKTDVVNLSLKIADTINIQDPSTQLLNRLLGLVPYVVAASGNGTGAESFPAHFETVTFDVGAFKYEKNKDQTRYPIISFSQYSKDYGPKFVEPGYNILSSGLVANQKVDSMYAFMSGTSMAAPIMTGFVALVLAEFKNNFTTDELSKVIYKSTIYLQDDEDWKTKSLLGTVDMRTCLLTLHILRALKARIKHEASGYNTTKQFDNLLQAAHYLLFAMPRMYSDAYLNGISIQNNFIEFAHKADLFKRHNYTEYKKHTSSLMPLFSKGSLKLDATVHHVTDWLMCCVKNTYKQQNSWFFTEKLYHELCGILTQPKVELFGNLNKTRQQRLEKKVIIDNYWKEQAKKLQEGA